MTIIGPGTRKNYVANFGGPANFMAWSGVLVPLKDNPPLSYAGVYSNSNSGTTFGMEGITDGSSNTAMFSETLLGSGPIVAGRHCPRRLGPVRTCGLSRIPNFWDQGPAGGVQALLFMQACKALPGITPSVGILPPVNGNIWLAGNPGSSLMWDAYNHFMPPNSTACAASNDFNINPGGWWSASERRLAAAGARSWMPFLRVPIIPAASTLRSPTVRCGSSRTRSRTRRGGRLAPATARRP